MQKLKFYRAATGINSRQTSHAPHPQLCFIHTSKMDRLQNHTISPSESGSNAVETALQLPEIREGIFQFLERKSLYNCALVNRAWSQQATRRIWRGQLFNVVSRFHSPTLHKHEVWVEGIPRNMWYNSNLPLRFLAAIRPKTLIFLKGNPGEDRLH